MESERKDVKRKGCSCMDIMKGKLGKIKARNFLLVGFIAVLWGILTFLSPHFIKISNILLLLQQSSIVMIAGIGMTFAILTSGIDLSIGSVAALSSVMVGIAITKWEIPVFLALLIGMLTGTLFGMLNGILISYFRLQPMIVYIGHHEHSERSHLYIDLRAFSFCDRLIIN